MKKLKMWNVSVKQIDFGTLPGVDESEAIELAAEAFRDLHADDVDWDAVEVKTVRAAVRHGRDILEYGGTFYVLVSQEGGDYFEEFETIAAAEKWIDKERKAGNPDVLTDMWWYGPRLSELSRHGLASSEEGAMEPLHGPEKHK